MRAAASDAGLSAEDITQVIREGRGTMPGFADLSVEEINSIMLFLPYPEYAPEPMSPQVESVLTPRD